MNARSDSAASPGSGSTGLALLAIFAAALFVRVVYLAEMGDSALLAAPLGDAAYYDAWARRIAGGEWVGSGAHYLSPGYAYFLGALYSLGFEPESARLFQAVLGALGCVLLASAAGRAFSPRTGVVAGALLALYAPAIYYDGLLQKPALASLLIVLTLELVTRYRAHARGRVLFGAGLVLGTLAVTRENLAVLPLVALAAIWVRPVARARLRDTGLLALGMLLALAPHVVRDRIAGVPAGLPANLGPNLFIGNSEHADGLYRPLVAGRGVPELEHEDAHAIAERESGAARDSMSGAEVSRFWIGRAFAWASSHPGDWLALTARKMWLFVSDREWMDSQSYLVYRAESEVLKVLGPVLRFGVLFALAVYGFALAIGRRAELCAWYVGVAICFASVLPFFVFGRLRFALVPFLVPFAALAARELARRVNASDWRGLRRPGAVFLVAGVISFWPVGELELAESATWTNVATALDRLGRGEEARALHERAARAGGDHADAHFNLGVSYALAGEVDAAREAFERAVEIRPAYFVDAHLEMARAFLAAGDFASAKGLLLAAHAAEPPTAAASYAVGALLSQAGLLDAAEEAYRRAVELDEHHADAHNNLAWRLATRGEEREAIRHFEASLASDPAHRRALFNYSRFLAGNPADAVRDPSRALELAERYRELEGEEDAGALDLWGMALSAAGRLDAAAEAAERAADAWRARGEGHSEAGALARAADYRAGRPYRY
ncbi:MAG: tetratricopeptide repeat protein [bacterium]|nr:tetratricopeptide repeat protein [bacterium]